MFLITKPCSFCITINGYIVQSCGQFITVVTPLWTKHPCLAWAKKGPEFYPRCQRPPWGSQPWMTAPCWPQQGGGKEPPPGSAHCWAGNLWEGSPAVANFSIFWEWKPSLINALIIKRKLSKWGYRIRVYKFWKQSVIFFFKSFICE